MVVAAARAFHKARPGGEYTELVDGGFKGAVGSGATLAAVALATSAGGPAGVALLVGLTAGIVANSATKNVSLTAIGRFVATRAAAMTTDPATEAPADPPEADGLDGADSDAMVTAHNLSSSRPLRSSRLSRDLSSLQPEPSQRPLRRREHRTRRRRIQRRRRLRGDNGSDRARHFGQRLSRGPSCPKRLTLRAYSRISQYASRIMERGSTPSLLPILRSRRQGELLALLLGDPELEASLTELSALLAVAVSSVHREIDRAESAGLVTSRKIGNTRLVRANTDSPYYRGLADVLVKAFGPPRVLAAALARIDNIDTAHIYGSWAARLHGASTDRAVGDIDVLVLGSPDRDELYAALSAAEQRLGRPVQATIRPADWISTGTGNFHATVTQRPLVEIDLTTVRTETGPRSR